jgi:SNF2 family DNA or RNA helicase
MLFEEERIEQKKFTRPGPPKGFEIPYQIGFLFNFVSGKSTRFDLEPVLFYSVNGKTEYKRISLQIEKALAFLHSLDDPFYRQLLEFSDERLLDWMTRTGNRFIRNHAGTWAHVSAKELVNLRKHYRDLLQPLWPALVQRGNIFILRTGRFNNFLPQTVKLATAPPRFTFRIDQQAELIMIRLILLLDGVESEINFLGGCLLEKNNTLYLPEDTEALSIIDLFKNGPITFPMSVKKQVVAKYLTQWLDKYEMVIGPLLNIEVSDPQPEPRILLSELNESNLMIRPQFSYEDITVDYGNETFHVMENGTAIRIIRRNKTAETSLYESLRSLHPSFAAQRNNQYYYLPFADVMKRGWFITMLRTVQDQGHSVHGFEDLKKFRYTTHEPRISIVATPNIDWFDLKVTIQWGDQLVSLKQLRHAILKGQDTLMLDDGTLGHIPDEWITQYSLLLRSSPEEDGVLKVNRHHYMLLEEILDKIEGNTVRHDIELKKRKLLDYDNMQKHPLSKEVKASLRPYQQSGLNWLQTLEELGWGACLADDMGLGKTLQAISFLQYLKEKYPGSTQLVVCPTSLIFNWENEIQKFCPSMRFHTHYGLQREFNETHFETYDVVLTTYGVIRNDLEHLKNFLWQYIVLDESQAIKNPDAQVTRAVQQLRSANRIILSGTPVQNNTFDLYSQFTFLNPGLLGNKEFFNREFAQPIDKFGSRERTGQLKKLIHPFTLRRTKEQVARDLPDKTVTVLWCVMDAGQRKLYNQYRDGYRNKLLKKIDEQGISKSGMDVLEGLLRLRQLCDHPGLVSEHDAPAGSVKIEELVRDIRENSGKHKFLVFSQFTEMLKLIKKEFEQEGISHCYLDGSTSMKQRKVEVEKFQEDETIKAFLISLKAGGVGLNLTVADYVYVVDPWWNPAAEHQAIDRAHRIGQKRKVFAYKMICKDTVEEKILQLQEKKKMLADDLIQEDAGFVKTLSRDDIEFLFG